MTREEAIRKMEFCKNAYQKLIDEEVDNGTFVGTGVNGVWKADTPLTKAYSDMVDACDMAIKALEQEPCEDAISRQAVLDGLASIAKAKAKSDAQKSLMGRIMFFTEHLPSVNPQEPKTGHWIFDDKCREHGHCSRCGYGRVDLVDGEPHNFCRNCGCRMVEPQESEG